MANVIQSSDLGNDQNNQNGQGPNSVNQAGQATNTNNANQAGQAPPQSQSGSAGNNTGQSAGQSASNQSTGSSNASGAGGVNDPNKQQGSGYTNIAKIINANQGNQLGSAIGNNIQQTATSAQQNLQNAQGQFNQQTQSNQANTQQNQQLAQNVLNDPTQYVNQSNNPANSQAGSQFQNLLSGQYQGPTALANASSIQNQAANAAQEGQALGTSGGRIALLQQTIGNPQYTQGQAGLDSLLLGQSNSPALQQAKQQALALQGQVNTGIAGAAAQGQQQQAQSQQFGQALQGQLGNQITSQTQAIQNQATQAQQANNAQYQQALSDLQSGNVNQNEANLLGLTQGENVYNVLNGNNAAQFLQENSNQANIANTANAKQYAQMQALQQLGGQYINQPAQQALQNFQNPSQAGSYAQQQNLIANQPAFQNALASTQANYNSILNPAQSADQYAQQIQNIWNRTTLAGNDPNSLSQNAASQAVAQLTGGGASGGTIAQQEQWSLNNLASQNQKLAAAQAQLQTQYGNPESINIQPQASAYPTIQGTNS